MAGNSRCQQTGSPALAWCQWPRKSWGIHGRREGLVSAWWANCAAITIWSQAWIGFILVRLARNCTPRSAIAAIECWKAGVFGWW